MKVMTLILLGPLFVGAAAAQAPSNAPTASRSQASAKVLDPPGVTVIHFKWQKVVYVPALYEDPMRPNEEHAALEREQKETIRKNVDRVKGGEEMKPLPTRAGQTAKDRQAPQMSAVNYLYQARIKYTGTKTISVIVWDYSLFDSENEVEVGRHRFRSNMNIGAGKTADLTARSPTQPAQIVTAEKSGKDLRGKYSEHVSIDRLEYDDGTFWQRSPN